MMVFIAKVLVGLVAAWVFWFCYSIWLDSTHDHKDDGGYR